jgi:addiction module RelB/DinJ family antitoxin
MKNAYINVRVDNEVKSKAEEIFSDLGFNTSTAIDMFLNQVIIKDGIPFEVKRLKKDVADKEMELARVINLTGGKDYPRKFKKIISLYAHGDIDFDVALYAIKKEYING